VQDFSALPAVAREAIRARLEARAPRLPRAGIAHAAAVFVTLRIDGELRGCMGTIEPRCPDVVRETMDRAVVAAFEDPRFPPLTADELERCAIEVAVLGPLEDVDERRPLDPDRFGVEVRDAIGRRGVLLPAIPGIRTAAAQVAVARRKAGIPEGATVSIRRFETVKVPEARRG
jgi:AmmeMemoRadiSam system protein A